MAPDDARMTQSMRMLLMTLEDSLGTLGLALHSAMRRNGRQNVPISEQTDWDTVAHLVHTIDGLLSLLEREGHQKRPEPTCESPPLLTLPVADGAPDSASAQQEPLSPAASDSTAPALPVPRFRTHSPTMRR